MARRSHGLHRPGLGRGRQSVNLGFVLTGVGRTIVALWLVVSFAFLIPCATGVPIEILPGEQAEPQVIEHCRTLCGRERPLHEQYPRYFFGIAKSDLGFPLADERPATMLLETSMSFLGRAIRPALTSLSLTRLTAV